MNNFDVGLLCQNRGIRELLTLELTRLGLSYTECLDRDTFCRLWIAEPELLSQYPQIEPAHTLLIYQDAYPSDISLKDCRLALEYPFPMSSFRQMLWQGLPLAGPATSDTSDVATAPLLLLIDETHCVCIGGGEPIRLTSTEFALLSRLYNSPAPLGRKEAQGLFGFDEKTNLLDVHICHLRRKLEENSHIKLLKTIRGQGYVLIK